MSDLENQKTQDETAVSTAAETAADPDESEGEGDDAETADE